MRQKCSLRVALCWWLGAVGLVSLLALPAMASPKHKKSPKKTRKFSVLPPKKSTPRPITVAQGTFDNGGGGDAPAAPPKPKGQPVELTFLYTTDLYGQFRDFRCKRPGVKGYKYSAAKTDIANLLQLVKDQRNMLTKAGKVPPVLLNTGDNLGTSLAARFLLEFEGLAGVDFIARVFKRFGYWVVGLGNHEFTPPREKLAAFLSQASSQGVKFLASNLVVPDKTKKPLQYKKFKKHAVSRFVNNFSSGKRKPYFVMEPEIGGLPSGIKVGVFHLLPGKVEAAKRNLEGISFEDPGTVASTVVEKLRNEEKVDVVIMLSHLGSKVKEVVLNSTGIDLVITNSFRTGNKATAFSVFDKKGKGVYIVSGTKFGTQLGKVILRVQRYKNGRPKVVGFQPNAIPLTAKRYDQGLRRELIKWETSYCKRWGKPLGSGRIRKGHKMTKEMFATYLLNLLRHMSGTELAFINKRALRNTKIQVTGQYGSSETVTRPFPIEGYITKDDIYRALPFEQGFNIIKLNGNKVSELLGTHASKFYFAGAADSKINSRDVAPNGNYTAVTIDFIVNNKMRGVDLGVDKKKVRVFRYKNTQRVMLRELLISHFARNDYRKLPKSPPPKKPVDPYAMPDPKAKKKKKVPPKPYGPDEIPHQGKFVDLARLFAITFNTTNSLSTTGAFISPINISTFGFSDFQDQNFQKFQGTIISMVKLEADSLDHFLRSQLDLNYNLYSSAQWINEPVPGRVQQAFFREEQDELKFTGEYVWKYFDSLSDSGGGFGGNAGKWYYPSPSLQYTLTTELSRGPRPDLTGFGFGDLTSEKDKEYFTASNVAEIYRRFEMEARLGVKFKVGPQRNLNVKVSLSWVRQFALQFCIQAQKTPDGKDVKGGVWCDGDPGQQPQAQVDRSHRIGVTVEYSHMDLEIGKFGNRPIKWNSNFEYRWNFSLLTNFYRDSHRLVFDNNFNYVIQGNLTLKVGVKFSLYNDFFRPTMDGDLIRGPIAVSIVPMVGLDFNWFYRYQDQ